MIEVKTELCVPATDHASWSIDMSSAHPLAMFHPCRNPYEQQWVV